MPKIGHIDVPDGLWKELIEFTIVDFPRAILGDIGDRYNTIDAPNRLAEFDSYAEPKYEELAQQLIALIRVQTSRPDVELKEIERGEDYLNIWHAARLVGEQVSFDAMFNLNNLKNLADKHVREM